MLGSRGWGRGDGELVFKRHGLSVWEQKMMKIE